MAATDITPAAVLGPQQGEAHWWTGELATIKATGAETNGHLALVEIVAPEGIEIPLHVHHREDEGFWVLEGELTFRLGDELIPARPGDFVLGPRGIPHTYTVEAGPARLLFLFAPAGFEGFIRETGEPARARELPPPSVQTDPERLAASAVDYGLELVG